MHNLTVCAYFGFELLTIRVPSPTLVFSLTNVPGAGIDFTQGGWVWSELTGFDQTMKATYGGVTIPACLGKTIS